MTITTKDRLNARMAPLDYAGRFRHWLIAIQAASIQGRAFSPPVRLEYDPTVQRVHRVARPLVQ